MEKVLELAVLVLVMVVVSASRTKESLHPVPVWLGVVAGVLATLAMVAAGAPVGAATATGLLTTNILAEIGDYALKRHR